MLPEIWVTFVAMTVRHTVTTIVVRIERKTVNQVVDHDFSKFVRVMISIIAEGPNLFNSLVVVELLSSYAFWCRWFMLRDG